MLSFEAKSIDFERYLFLSVISSLAFAMNFLWLGRRGVIRNRFLTSMHCYSETEKVRDSFLILRFGTILFSSE